MWVIRKMGIIPIQMGVRELCRLTKKFFLSAIAGICTDVSRLNVQGVVTLLSVIQKLFYIECG